MDLTEVRRRMADGRLYVYANMGLTLVDDADTFVEERWFDE